MPLSGLLPSRVTHLHLSSTLTHALLFHRPSSSNPAFLSSASPVSSSLSSSLAAILDDQSVCGRGERLALALARENINSVMEGPARARVEVDIYELQKDSQYDTTDTSEWSQFTPETTSREDSQTHYRVIKFSWIHQRTVEIRVKPTQAKYWKTGDYC